jgi:aryl-alcohol dehydrogenase-like predicted oxidoreductase
MEPSNVVANMQKFLDAGMASFQLKTSSSSSSSSSSRPGTNADATSGLQEWGEEEIFGRLRKETPAFALRNCHLVVPLHIPGPDAVGTVTALSIRQTVLESLGRTGGDCIDTIQLLPNPHSPYALDVLDCLQDLKREGYVRSVAGKSLDWRLVKEAHRCGFSIDSNQVDGNLLDPNNFDNPEQRLACEDLGTKLLVAGPLAGGLLSGRHYMEPQEGRRRGRRGRQPSPSQQMEQARERRNRPLFNPSESHHLETTLVRWGERHGQQDSDDPLSAARWKLFQSKIMSTLHDIAQKHDVSVSTVALRWTLQTQHVAATVVSCRLLSSEDRDPQVLRDRPKQLRQVFQLNLDDEDMERLWEVSGRLAPEPPRDRDEEELYMEMMESKKGLFLPPSNRRQQTSPDRSNRALWL